MHFSLKIVAVLLVCTVMLSEARPPRGGQGHGAGMQGPGKGSKKGGKEKPKEGNGAVQPPRRHDAVRGAGRFCSALVNGNITNDNATFDVVFFSVTGVCKDLLAWIEANKPTDAPSAEGARQRRALVRGGPAGGRKFPGGAGRAEGEDADAGLSAGADRRHDNQTAVQILLHVCEGVEKIPVDDATIPEDLKPIITRFDAICDEAQKLAGDDNVDPAAAPAQ